jgi:alpha-tubulin suppressor-like RCC1 family protein
MSLAGATTSTVSACISHRVCNSSAAFCGVSVMMLVGQLGLGYATTTGINGVATPSFTGLTSAIDVSCGQTHVCALMSTRGIRCWGFNGYGQLGDGTTVDKHSPPVTDLLSGIAFVSLKHWHTCVLRTNGEAACWGRNNYGMHCIMW